MAMLVAIVLLPTPPLPEPTAITLLAWRPIWPSFSGGRSCGTTSTETFATWGNAVRTSSSIRARVALQRIAEWLVRPTATAIAVASAATETT